MLIHQPLVTIAIPTFNRASSYLRDSLGSACAQTYPNIEILVSDNCSADGTPSFVRNFNDQRIRYYRQPEPLRPNDNFNFCLENAKGEYFLLLLDDEIVDHDFVATCIDAAHGQDEVGIIRTGIRVIDANGALIREIPNLAAGLPFPEFFIAWFKGRTALYLCNTLFRTETLRAVGGMWSRHCLFQDVMAQIKVMARSRWIDLAVPKSSTRSHPGQFTYGATVRGWAEDATDLLSLIESVSAPKSEHVRVAGSRFFSEICFSRAGMIRHPGERLKAYVMVYRHFNRRHLPPARMVLSSTAIYRKLRNIKRRLKGQPSWAAAG